VVDGVLTIQRPGERLDLFMVEVQKMMHKTETDTVVRALTHTERERETDRNGEAEGRSERSYGHSHACPWRRRVQGDMRTAMVPLPRAEKWNV
jgi:hypothetical protein